MPKRKLDDLPRVPRVKATPPSKKRRPLTPENQLSPLDYEWKSPKINRVKVLHDAGFSARDIRQKKTVPEKIQWRMIAGPKRRSGKPSLTKRSGKHKISKNIIKEIIYSLQNNYRRRTWDWESLRIDFKFNCTLKTIRKILNNRGYYKYRIC